MTVQRAVTTTVRVDAEMFLARTEEVVRLYDRVFTAPHWNDDPAETEVFSRRLPCDAALPGFAGQDRAWLITRTTVTEAVAFYERIGWRSLGIRGRVILYQSPTAEGQRSTPDDSCD